MRRRFSAVLSEPSLYTYSLVSPTELYYITGGSARGKKVKQKTWRIFAMFFASLC